MEEEVNYVAVTFKTNSLSKQRKTNDQDIIYDEVKTCQELEVDTTPDIPENPNELDIIYDEVKTGQKLELDTAPAIPVSEKRAARCTLLHLLAALLLIICIVLSSIVFKLSSNLNSVLTENMNLTAQNQQLWTERTDLGRRAEELTRQRDGLSWTIGSIMEYEYFQVKAHCPHKVCKPCLDGWILFQSNCYFFSGSNSFYDWKDWDSSRAYCKHFGGDLVVIESQEEQEFITNHTVDYNDQRHGYWVGLSKKDATWSWVNGGNFTVMFWKPQQSEYRVSCALSQPREEPLSSWLKVACDMWNRWICETRTLIKPDLESDALSQPVI